MIPEPPIPLGAGARLQALLMRLAYAQLVLSGAAAVGTWIVQVLAGLPRDPVPSVAVFLVFFSIYTLDRVAAEPETDALNHPERERFARRHARKLLGLAAAAYAAALVLAARGGPGRLLILLLPLVAVLLYSFPFVPRRLARRLGFSRLKEILVVKNGVMAGTFATTLTLAPLPTQGAGVSSPPLMALWAFLFVRFLINSIVSSPGSRSCWSSACPDHGWQSLLPRRQGTRRRAASEGPSSGASITSAFSPLSPPDMTGGNGAASQTTSRHMTEWKTDTATVHFRELDLSELERVSGGYAQEVLLNPQPLPPRAASLRSSFSWVALNPQPEPPGIVFSLRS